MIEADIVKLASQASEEGLEGLEADVWAAVTERERSVRLSRRLLALQGIVLVAALTGALMAGWSAASADRSSLDVFSPHMALSASTLLAGNPP